MMPVADEYSVDSQHSPNYKQKYKTLKRKLKYLLYEQECFREELKKCQRKLLKVSRDKSFLLDRLLQYEQIEDSSSESEDTMSSSSDNETKGNDNVKSKKKKITSHSLQSLSYSMESFNPQLFGGMGYPGILPSSSQTSSHLPGSLESRGFTLPQLPHENPTFSDIPPKKPKKSRSSKTGTSSKSGSGGSKKGESNKANSSELSMSDVSPRDGMKEEDGGPPEDMYEGDDNLIIDIPE
ncbi:uncharacterized protein LOC144449203 [Glandiceps talaboti]